MTVSAPTSRPSSSGRQFLEGMVGLAVILIGGSLIWPYISGSSPYAGQTVGKHWTVSEESRGFGCRSWTDVQEVLRETGLDRDRGIRRLVAKTDTGACVLLKPGVAVLITETGSDRFRFRTGRSGPVEFWGPKAP